MQWYALANDTIKPLDETDAIREGERNRTFFERNNVRSAPFNSYIRTIVAAAGEAAHTFVIVRFTPL